MKIIPSSYQLAIFTDIAKGSGHTIIEACAGSGKTRTLIEGFKFVPKKQKILMMAFNKSIAEELRSQAPSYVDTFTSHSLGFRTIKKCFGNVSFVEDKAINVVRKILPKEYNNFSNVYSICRLLNLSKGFLTDTPKSLENLIDNFGIDTYDVEIDKFISFTIKALGVCKELKNIIDYDDMIYFPFCFNLPIQQFDYVFLDEVQDFNPAQVYIATSACKRTGRIIATGDSSQNLYSWRSVDINSMEKLTNKLQAKRLPLSISYRCAKNIVKLANSFVPQMEAHISNIDGIISETNDNDLIEKVKPGDFVLSRVNAPLINYCLSLLKLKIPANIQGRDIGTNLSHLIKQSETKDVDSFLFWLDKWKTIEYERLRKKNKDTTFISDKIACLQSLCEGENKIENVQNKIKLLFKDSDSESQVIFSTIHRAKGLERDRAFVLLDTFKSINSQEEKNVMYVAITRAKKELILVSNTKEHILYSFMQKLKTS